MEEKKTLEILVIEDKENHIADVKNMLEKRQEAGVKINVTYVDNLEEAHELMQKVDGVISDIFFPTKKNGTPENQAYNMVDKAKQLSKYIVFCTDGDHHGPHLEGLAQKLGRVPFADNPSWEEYGNGAPICLGMVDFAVNHPDRLDRIIESRMKNWPKAYFLLMKVLDRKEAGEFRAYLVKSGIDVKAILNSYWGPNLGDLVKIYQK